MNQEMEKENSNTTITRLFDKMEEDEEERLFLKPADVTQPIIHHAGYPQPLPQQKSDKVYIEEILRKDNMLVEDSNIDPAFSNDYGRIKRPLLSNAFGKSASLLEKGNFILVTSSIPGEGKTYTAINLALSIAHERDHTVLLIDCDTECHGTSSALGITDKPGLTDILEDDKISVADIILRTDIPELCLISSGKKHDFVTELLASQRMSELVSEIGSRYDDRIIIFDGSPLLSTPQTQVLSNLVGQVVFVIEAGKTPQTVIEEALDMISEERATGLVMNKCEGIPGRSSYDNYGEK
jgi:exopolysaccharide/PEP-CTERM locus tyrosine autokinase